MLSGNIANTPSYIFSYTNPAGSTLAGLIRPKEYIFVKVLSKESETWAYSSWVHKEIKCENIVPVFENTK